MRSRRRTLSGNGTRVPSEWKILSTATLRLLTKAGVVGGPSTAARGSLSAFADATGLVYAYPSEPSRARWRRTARATQQLGIDDKAVRNLYGLFASEGWLRKGGEPGR